MIYLDNSATTRPFPQVMTLMADMQQNIFGNPSSLHHAGVLAERAIMQAREQVLEAFGQEDGNFIFTAGGTEANNLAILGTMLSRIHRSPRIITSKIEHPSVMETVLYCKNLGADCHFVEVDSQGQIDEEHFCSLLNEETALVSIMSVNNEVGSMQNIARLSAITKAANPKALFHTDAVQALGKMPLFVKESGADLVSVSSHKIHGPKGAGGLFIRRGIHVKPILFGGGQEKGLRSGTQNTPAIAGFGLATQMTLATMKKDIVQMEQLRLHLQEGLATIAGCQVIKVANPAPHIVCATFPGIRSETLLHALEAQQVYVSSGSACSSNKPQLSPTLLALGYNRKEIEGALRFSLSPQTTLNDINAAIAATKEQVAFLRNV
ncbi:MAG: cysteine desulfurase [Ruminococcaceae bacterium]|nr:cysteine desulfurase [Oscillospiraceae bacterium]